MNTAAETNPPARGTGAYDVARPQGLCGVCNAAIEPEVKYIAALRESPTGLVRLDCCMGCWEKAPQQDVLAHWKTAMPRSQAKKKLFVDDPVLCDLFERLSETREPSKLNFRFVLGLILMRKRMLIYEETRREGNDEIWSVRFKLRTDRLDLINPHLAEEQVQDVSRQLGEILNEEL